MAASLMQKISHSLFSHSSKLSYQTGPNQNGMLRCISHLTTRPAVQNVKQPCIQTTGDSPRSLLAVTIPLIESVRTAIRYSIRKGKPKTVKAVVNRFFRMPWGQYIRPRAGRHKSKWSKPDWINERAKYHVFTNKTQSRMLDKMTTSYWKKRRFYVNDPYEPYMKRTKMNYTPPKFFP
ncbi:mitochondrial 54S ribosomal protein YmL35 [Mactra antiquata]